MKLFFQIQLGIVIFVLCIFGLVAFGDFIFSPHPEKVCPEKICKNDYLKDTTIFKNAENFGYANGLVMAARILGEQEMFIKEGHINKNEIKTCEQVVDDLYEMGQPVASGEQSPENL